MKAIYQPDALLDLSFTRIVDVPRSLVWRAWTEPDLLMRWFCPLPWKTIDCEMDLQPGGMFRTTMQSPEGKNFPNSGCNLQVIHTDESGSKRHATMRFEQGWGISLEQLIGMVSKGI